MSNTVSVLQREIANTFNAQIYHPPQAPSHSDCLPVYQQTELWHTGYTTWLERWLYFCSSRGWNHPWMLHTNIPASLSPPHRTSMTVSPFDPKCCHSSGRKSNRWQLKCLCTSKSVRIFSSPGQAQDISSVKQYKNYTLKPPTGRQSSRFWTEYLEHLSISGPVTFLACSLKQQDEDVPSFVQIFQLTDSKPTEAGVIQ